MHYVQRVVCSVQRVVCSVHPVVCSVHHVQHVACCHTCSVSHLLSEALSLPSVAVASLLPAFSASPADLPANRMIIQV